MPLSLPVCHCLASASIILGKEGKACMQTCNSEADGGWSRKEAALEMMPLLMHVLCKPVHNFASLSCNAIIGMPGPRGKNKNRICFDIKQDRSTTFADLPLFPKLRVSGK